TYYRPSNDACSKYGHSSRSSDMVAAMNKAQFGGSFGGETERSSICGRCVQVKGPRGTAVVKIVDMCETCRHGHVDLSPAAFRRVANPVDGRVSVTWKY
ncbi:RlpA-like double-psi beta-barrel-protein domain-containing protein-containing protein, partial [Thamnocephalis sphaerospora]